MPTSQKSAILISSVSNSNSYCITVWFLLLLSQLTPLLMQKCDFYMYLDSAQCAEVNRMLSVMLEAQQQDVNAHPACGTALSYSLGQKALVSHSLAMLWFLCNDHMKVNVCPLMFKRMHTNAHTSTKTKQKHTSKISIFI